LLKKRPCNDLALYFGKLAIIKISMDRSFVSSDDLKGGENYHRYEIHPTGYQILLFSIPNRRLAHHFRTLYSVKLCPVLFGKKSSFEPLPT
ncbi:MAG: hypothetical protein WCK17_10025, partial [Verrucomicrobiota bacterium]